VTPSKTAPGSAAIGAAVRYNRPAMNYLIIALLVVIFLVLVGVRVWKRMN
jgi:hypothetical protein